MTPLEFSSGDLIADRRADYAEGLLAAGDPQAAADLYAQALEVSPGWAVGWYRLGEIRADHGLPGAEEALAEALRRDPADTMGAGPKLDLLRGKVAALPPAFVEALFDQYAGRFEDSLVGALGYRAPQRLRAGLPGRFGRALDLGCGTGLMGAELRPAVDWLEGWDISAEMLREAGAKGIYDRLEKRDLSAPPACAGAWDLITAADVFSYLGALEGIIGWAAVALRPAGRLAFTVERHDGTGYVLRDSRRYAHSEVYVRKLLADHGFAADFDRAMLRMDRGAPIEALFVQARREAPRP
ncbi:methyltransferase domain-containing protein [Paenirhodobacter sp.]|uniref:class I SAM-dependent DNA methyltransferase n=1 Tax=Paenirhodobacter sp. TaxID=1965326 RepID=UPI003B3E7AC1